MRCLIRFFFAVGGTFVLGMVIVEPGPLYPPTKGEVWPKPQQQTTEDTYFIYNPTDFNIKVSTNYFDNICFSGLCSSVV